MIKKIYLDKNGINPIIEYHPFLLSNNGALFMYPESGTTTNKIITNHVYVPDYFTDTQIELLKNYYVVDRVYIDKEYHEKVLYIPINYFVDIYCKKG